MIDNTIKKELEDKVGFIIRTFGTVDDYLNSNNPDTVELNVHKLLSHPGKISIISPWNCCLKLYEDNGMDSYSNESIVFNQPYNLYDTKGRLLYTVTEHEGIFGNSVLDKALLLKSSNADLYYLQYATYTGVSKTRLLIVNNKSLVTNTTNIANNYNKVPVISNIEETVINQIVFNSNNLINLFYIPGAPIRVPKKEVIINNPYVIKSSAEGQLIFNPDKSGWLVCTDRNNNYLKFNNIIGAGTDRLLSINEEDIIHYIIIGSESDVTTLKQTLQIRGLGLESTAISNVINLQVSL